MEMIKIEIRDKKWIYRNLEGSYENIEYIVKGHVAGEAVEVTFHTLIEACEYASNLYKSLPNYFITKD